jgi:hypothetical protein
MHMYETTTGIRRKNPGYTGLFAIPVRVDLPGMGAWAVVRTTVPIPTRGEGKKITVP